MIALEVRPASRSTSQDGTASAERSAQRPAQRAAAARAPPRCTVPVRFSRLSYKYGIQMHTVLPRYRMSLCTVYSVYGLRRASTLCVRFLATIVRTPRSSRVEPRDTTRATRSPLQYVTSFSIGAAPARFTRH